MTKRNIRDNFEEIYLYYNSAKKHMNNASTKELKSHEFNKSVNYMANHYYLPNRKLFNYCGYELEDIMSIAHVFGATFVGADYKTNTKREYYLLLMNYLDQRLSHLVAWLIRKFNVDEIVCEIHLENFDFQIADESISFGDMICIEGQSESALIDHMNFLTMELDVEVDTDKKSKLSEELKGVKKEFRKKSIVKRGMFRGLKQKLESEPEKYKNLLVYYAITKHVSVQTRKVARRYCKKYGFDYKVLGKAMVNERNYEMNEFTI